MTAYPILSVTTFLPLLGAALVLFFGGGRRARWIGLLTTLATLASPITIYLFISPQFYFTL